MNAVEKFSCSVKDDATNDRCKKSNDDGTVFVELRLEKLVVSTVEHAYAEQSYEQTDVIINPSDNLAASLQRKTSKKRLLMYV